MPLARRWGSQICLFSIGFDDDEPLWTMRHDDGDIHKLPSFLFASIVVIFSRSERRRSERRPTTVRHELEAEWSEGRG